MQDAERWNELAAQLAVDSIRATTAAGSGHPSSSLSAAHLVAVLVANHLGADPRLPHASANDRFVLSKGHAAPLLYAAFRATGVIDDRTLLSLRRAGSPLQGHPAPVPELPWVEVATGSLGQGLSIGLGMCLAMRLDDSPAHVWVLLGDSELTEGAVWEAMATASFHGVSRLHAILDMNRLGQCGATMLEWQGDVYAERARAFGWNVEQIDGHDVRAIDAAYRAAEASERPTFIVARTQKGYGVSQLENLEHWHGKALSKEQATKAIEELGGERSLRIELQPPRGRAARARTESSSPRLRRYDEPQATRAAFGDALAALASWPDVVVLDGEVGNSTYTERFEAEAPERFFEMYIGEQNMIGAAVGLSVLGKRAFAATFGAFLTRAYDQIRMAAVSRADLRLCGSHAGVSIGEDGPSQMALEDIAMMRAVCGSTVLCPADANATAQLVLEMAKLRGISYLRTMREKTPILYRPEESFPIGGSKLLRSSARDRVTLVGVGVTVFEALSAADELARSDIAARVIDAYSIKPIDTAALRRALEETELIVTVEDHWIQGGLGDAVLAALASNGAPLSGRVCVLGVSSMVGSAMAEEQRRQAGIDAASIVAAVRKALLDGA